VFNLYNAGVSFEAEPSNLLALHDALGGLIAGLRKVGVLSE
jgi:hypothetical protein